MDTVVQLYPVMRKMASTKINITALAKNVAIVLNPTLLVQHAKTNHYLTSVMDTAIHLHLVLQNMASTEIIILGPAKNVGIALNQTLLVQHAKM